MIYPMPRMKVSGNDMAVFEPNNRPDDVKGAKI